MTAAPKRRSALLSPGIVAWAVGLGLAAHLYNEMYWRWRDCFNELGRCFDPEAGVVYHEQAGAFWLVAVLVFGLGLAGSIVRRLRQPNRGR